MELLLTRRQTLQSLAFAAVGGVSLFSLAGCGGGGDDRSGSGPAKTTTVRVPVELPSGFSLPLAELEAGTAFGVGAVADGGFSAKVVQDAPTFAFLRHKPSGKFVMFGLVGAGRPGLTPLGSAAGAMALAMGLSGLPAKDLAASLALLEAHADVKALGQAIASAMATDPYAITAESGAVAGAIKTAFDAFKGGGERTSARPTEATGAKSLGRAPAPQILVGPTDVQSGFQVQQGDAGQILPGNLKRRPASAYTYRVGHTPGAGAGDGAAAFRVNVQDLVATTSLLGSVVTLGASPVWTPVPGEGVALTVDGDDKKTHYETVVLMGSSGWGSDPAFFTDARYAGEIAEWRAKAEVLNQYAFNGIFLDVFKTLGSAALGVLSYAGSAAISGQLAATLPPSALIILKRGVFAEPTYALLKALVGGNGAARRVVVFALGQAGAPVLGLESAAVTASIVALAEFALAALAASGALLGLADALGTGWDAVTSPTAARWQETALKADLAITPETAEIAPGAELVLTVDVVGRPAPSDTQYTWTIAGGSDLAVLSDGHGKTGRTFETDRAAVTLATTPSTQGEITVTCEAYVGDDILGPVTAKVKMGADDGLNWTSATYGVYEFPADGNVGVVPYVSVGALAGATAYYVRDLSGKFGNIAASVGAPYPNPPRAGMSPYDDRYYQDSAISLLAYVPFGSELARPVPPDQVGARRAYFAELFSSARFEWAARTG